MLISQMALAAGDNDPARVDGNDRNNEGRVGGVEDTRD